MTFWSLPRAPGDGAKKVLLVANSYEKHTPKFGWISDNGLGGDGITDWRMDGLTDGGDYNIPFAFFKKSVRIICLFVALRPKSTAMVIAGRSVHLTTLFPGQAWASG